MNDEFSTVSEDIIDILNEEGYAESWGTILINEDAENIEQLSVYDVGGYGYSESYDKYKDSREMPTFMVKCISVDYVNCQRTLRKIRKLLISIVNKEIGNWFYLEFQPIGDVNYVGRSENNLVYCTLNMYAIRRKV